MATVKQIQYRIVQTKKKVAKLNKDLNVTKSKMKTLEGQLKKAKVAIKARPKKSAISKSAFTIEGGLGPGKPKK